MLFSLIVLFYFLLIQFFANNAKNYINKGLPYYVLFLSFIILNIFRIYCQSFFPDIPNYKSIFEAIKPISYVINSGYGLEYYDADVEIGIRVLISIFKLLSNSFLFFLFIISIIELLVFYLFCKKYNISLVNVFPIYIGLTYLTFQIGMLRQALAFCCFLLALVYINRKIIYILFILIGFTFHKSILFCIILFWSDKFANRKILYGIFFFSLVLYILKIDIINNFVAFIGMEDTMQAARVGFYMNVDRPNSFLGIGFWERLISFVLMNLIYTDLVKKNKINKNNNLIYNLGISVILLQMIFFSSPTITSRLRYFIVIFPSIFISEYIYSECKSKLKLLYQFLFNIYLLMYLIFQATYLI
jgi:hypothetical protein